MSLELIMLGTGNAAAINYYNTCFAIREKGECFLVDAGGGNTILGRLKQAGIGMEEVRHLFVTHKHIDHLLGVIWLVRVIAQQNKAGKIKGDLTIYGHEEVIQLILEICEKLLDKKQTCQIGTTIRLKSVEDGECAEILRRKVQFFDIKSEKAKQFGFSMELEEGKRLCCCGDEPLHAVNEDYARGCCWLLHEAFCLDTEARQYKPFEKSHTTVRRACERAEEMGVENLLLYHTEDSRPESRKEVYAREGSRYFHGNLYIPDELERISL